MFAAGEQGRRPAQLHWGRATPRSLNLALGGAVLLSCLVEPTLQAKGQGAHGPRATGTDFRVLPKLPPRVVAQGSSSGCGRIWEAAAPASHLPRSASWGHVPDLLRFPQGPGGRGRGLCWAAEAAGERGGGDAAGSDVARLQVPVLRAQEESGPGGDLPGLTLGRLISECEADTMRGGSPRAGLGVLARRPPRCGRDGPRRPRSASPLTASPGPLRRHECCCPSRDAHGHLRGSQSLPHLRGKVRAGRSSPHALAGSSAGRGVRMADGAGLPGSGVWMGSPPSAWALTGGRVP